MSGLPAGGPEDRTPNRVVSGWPPETQTILSCQRNEVMNLCREEIVALARENGVERIALEFHGNQCVFNVPSLLKLREAVGRIVGANLDPSGFLTGLAALTWMENRHKAVTQAREESSDEKAVPAESTESLDRRLFLRSLGKWSGAVILAVAGGTWFTSCVSSWINRGGVGGGGGWINRRGVVGGGWINRRGGYWRWWLDQSARGWRGRLDQSLVR